MATRDHTAGGDGITPTPRTLTGALELDAEVTDRQAAPARYGAQAAPQLGECGKTPRAGGRAIVPPARPASPRPARAKASVRHLTQDTP